MKKIFLSALAVIGFSTMSYAVPAMPGVHTFTQPDGSTVTVRLVGDERSHYYLSEDNYPLITDAQGRLCYAEIGSDGIVRASKMQASNPVKRAPAENDLIMRADAADLQQKLAAQLYRNSRMNAPQTGMGLSDTKFPSTGEVRSLAILVDYQDVHFTTPNAQDYFYRRLNEEGFSDNGATGSARDFYIASSNGKFRPIFDVVGPVELPNKRSYYGRNNSWTGADEHPEQMVIHACQLLDDEVDFSLYDADDDGIIDNIYVFYAGTGEASGGPSESVWPHSWDVLYAGGQNYRFDGKALNHYACSNEWMAVYGGVPDGIGTFCHEFGHVLGLPDLYDTVNQGSGNGPGTWSTMAGGPYNNNSRTPPTFSSYERNALSWLDFQTISGAASVDLDHLLESNFSCLIPSDKETEFFFLENRQLQGWDAFLPHHGMLVWHIDYDKKVFNDNVVNNDATHQYVDLVEAGGLRCPDSAVPFPGSRNITTYDANPWSRVDLELPVTNIKEENGIISFDVCGGIKSIGNPTVISAVTEASTPYSLTLEWEAVKDASQYLLSVWKGENDYVGGYYEKGVRGLSHVVEGLEPETLYHFSIKAKAGQAVSAEAATGSASTTDMSFAFFIPQTLPADNVGKDGFTARWEPVEGAVDYEISISAVKDGRSVTVTADNGISVPSGWNTNGIKNFTVASYCGKAVPALRLDADNGHLTTQVFENELRSLEFWYRGSGNGAGNSISVQFRASADDEWKTVHTISPISGTGTTVLVNAPASSRQGRIVYSHPESGALSLDDVTALTIRAEIAPVEGFDKLLTGSTSCSFDFAVTPEMNVRDEFYYSVAAVNAKGNRTLASEPRYVNLNQSGVENVVETADASFRVHGLQIVYVGEADVQMSVYDTTGRLVGTATADGNGTAVFTATAPGFYVAIAGGKSAKALCR